ncbi:MAG: ATP-dependent DNA helicase [Candidatus Woesearchaeota archaeon]
MASAPFNPTSPSQEVSDLLFPYETLRPVQRHLLADIHSAIVKRQHILVHAPTGLGKTAAALAPALSYAYANQKVVFFLTSRHTQHFIALETCKAIKDKYKIPILATDLIGKKNMCLMPNIEQLYPHEFFEYCKRERENRTCEYYVNTRDHQQRLTAQAKALLSSLNIQNPLSTSVVIEQAKEEACCPYEITVELAKQSHLIIADYSYGFHPTIATKFLKKIGKSYEDLIMIVDEAHHLPQRMRELASSKLTSVMIKRAILEAKKFGYVQALPLLAQLQHALVELTHGLETKEGKEAVVPKESLEQYLEEGIEHTALVLDETAKEARGLRNHSALSQLGPFLEAWMHADHSFCTLAKIEQGKQEEIRQLALCCLDPSPLLREVIDQTHSLILMSATLTPVTMYADLLGFTQRTVTKTYPSPFPKTNKLNIIVPKTTTQFKQRNHQQYRTITETLQELIGAMAGNVAVFFPSYEVMDSVLDFLVSASFTSIQSPRSRRGGFSAFSGNVVFAGKPVFIEQANSTKQQREDLLARFKSYALHEHGAVLFACQAGSFGEGIDFPGNVLQGVIIVGLPLLKPNLETKELIAYYDRRFGKGWEYGYVAPAFSKILQSAGRCIRSATDHGVIIFLDERFAWDRYRQYFPPDEHYHVLANPLPTIKAFFSNQQHFTNTTFL